MKEMIRFIGLDVHKDFISVAIADEAMRDLVRARENAVCAYRVSRQRLNGFLLRHGKVYGGKSSGYELFRKNPL